MRWEQLFADMEAQLAAERLADLRAEVAELARAERASVTLSARVRASVGQSVRVRVDDTEAISGTLVEAAPEWMLLATSPTRRALVPLAAVAAVDGLVADAAPDPGLVESRLGLGQVLRALARDRVGVRVSARGVEVVGRIDRVGADHLDVAELGAQGRRALWAVSFSGLLAVHEA